MAAQPPADRPNPAFAIAGNVRIHAGAPGDPDYRHSAGWPRRGQTMKWSVNGKPPPEFPEKPLPAGLGAMAVTRNTAKLAVIAR